MRPLALPHRSDADTARGRSQQPPQARRPVAPQDAEHGEGLVPSPVSRSTSAPANGAAGAGGLAGIRHGNDTLALQPGVATANPNGVEAMGVKSGDGGTPLARQVPSRDADGDAKPVIRRRRRRRGDTTSVNSQAVLSLLEQQAFRCALTGRRLEPETAALDHVVPVSRGGEHRIDNTQVLERTVNRAKGTLTNGEFIALCSEVVRHVGEPPEAQSHDREPQNTTTQQ